ncbi:MAG: hypothetical protein NVSMB26_27020 [Beijerinckiaceae bacterium]
MDRRCEELIRMPRKRLPDDTYPNPDERFDRLLELMVEQAAETQHTEYQTSDQERDEDYSDTQTPKDTSEGVS